MHRANPVSHFGGEVMFSEGVASAYSGVLFKRMRDPHIEVPPDLTYLDLAYIRKIAYSTGT